MLCGNDLGRHWEDMVASQQSDKGLGVCNCLRAEKETQRGSFLTYQDVKRNGERFVLSD